MRCGSWKKIDNHIKQNALVLEIFRGRGTRAKEEKKTVTPIPLFLYFIGINLFLINIY